MMVGSSLLGAVFTISGLWLSYAFNLTSGACIILVSGIVFFLNFVADRLIISRNRDSGSISATHQERGAKS
jgi:zinc transport system permease protein